MLNVTYESHARGLQARDPIPFCRGFLPTRLEERACSEKELKKQKEREGEKEEEEAA